jgi:hypothetical protein
MNRCRTWLACADAPIPQRLLHVGQELKRVSRNKQLTSAGSYGKSGINYKTPHKHAR